MCSELARSGRNRKKLSDLPRNRTMFHVSEAGGLGGRGPPSASHAKCHISQKHTSVLIVSTVVVSVQVVSVVVVPVIYP